MAKIRIGRSSSNEVVLKDTTVSRSHAEIEDIGGGLYRLTDVGSSAGTFVKEGGKWSQITSAEIGPDAQVRFGEAEITLSDIVNTDPATVAPRGGASGLGQRAEEGAAEQSRQGAGGGGASGGGAGASGGGGARGGGAGASGGGWSGLSPNYRIGIIVGAGVFVLLIVVAVIVGLAGGEGGTSTVRGSTGGGATGGGVSGSAAKARLEQVMLTSCTKRGRKQDVCRCVAKNIVAGISDADAKAIVNAQRGGGKPPAGVMRKFLASAFAAGRTCAKRQG